MGLRKYLVPFSISVLVMIYPLRGGDTLGLGFLPSALALSLMGLAFLSRLRESFVLTKSDIIVLSYLLLTLVSVLTSDISDISLRYLIQISALSVLPYFIIRIRGFTIDEANNFLRVFPLMSLFAAGSMVVIVGYDQLMAYSGYRLGTELFNPVGIGYAFGLGALITAAGLKLRACGPIVGLLSIAVSVTILTFTGSRGAMLALALTSVALFVGRLNWRFAGGLCATAVSAYLAFGMLSDVMVDDRFSNAISSASVQSRFESWKQALIMFEQRPLLGHGLGAYEAQHGEYVHNVLLEHLSNGGLTLTIPFLLVVLVLSGKVLAGLATRSDEVVTILALIAMYALIVRLFSMSMANTKDVFLFFAMALSCAQSLKRRTNRQNKGSLAQLKQSSAYRS